MEPAKSFLRIKRSSEIIELGEKDLQITAREKVNCSIEPTSWIHLQLRCETCWSRLEQNGEAEGILMKRNPEKYRKLTRLLDNFVGTCRPHYLALCVH